MIDERTEVVDDGAPRDAEHGGDLFLLESIHMVEPRGRSELGHWWIDIADP